MTRALAPELLNADFDAREREVGLRYSIVAHVLLITLMPAGVSLDWFVYPQHLREFATVRLLVAAFAGVALLLHRTRFVKQNIRWFTMLTPWLVNAAISWMVYRTEGAASPYYAGLNLVMAGIGVLSVWSFAEATLTSLLTLVFYGVACVAKGPLGGQVHLFYNNLYFLVLTSVVSVTAAYFKRRARFEEFRLSSDLARAYEQASELERLKTDFFANVSHELRTPLTLILSPLSDLLNRAAELPRDLRGLAGIAHDNSLRLLKLINDLLELGRLESSEFKVRLERLELCQFASAQTESMRPLARLKNLDLDFEAGTSASFVFADPAQLEKIFINLLTNAIKFTPHGGKIRVRVTEKEGEARVEVADTGIGISEADLPHVFERFRQADGSSTRAFSGVGIGLSLARELAEKQGATLEAESRLGEGSTFRLRLPLRAAESELEPGLEPAAPGAAAREDSLAALFRQADRFVPHERAGSPIESDPPPGGERASVLVIDDEPDMRRYLHGILSDRYAVREASDGAAGLESARGSRPDLVLVDLMMPKLDGWQVSAALKREFGEDAPKVVVVTARTDEMAKISALRNGADDFMSKPFSTLEVRTRLANLERTLELERSLRKQNQELKRALASLQAAEALLVQREKMKAVVQLAGGILHEINNPLNFTMTAISVALDRYGDKDQRLGLILEDVRAGMVRIRDIISDLRSFAHPTNADHYERFDLETIIAQALRFTAIELDQVQVDHAQAGECPVYGSRSQLLQVLTNLLLNAGAAVRQVAAERKPTIRISAEVLDGRTRVQVWDNGGGIPPHLVDRVFDPFLTTRDVGEGLGLGLSICHSLVTAHGGEIRIRSQHGSWTEVAFELPLQERGVAA
ncbi:MAG TPA: ATP-binding protein [Polyangiaceae bacterium]